MSEKMNPKVKARWLKALRSGKFKQGRGMLKRSNNRHCCWGVLCELHRRATKCGWWVKDFDGSFSYHTIEDTNSAYPPKPVLRWAAFSSSNGEVKLRNGKFRTLADLNDTGRTFKTIANAIERSL